MPRLYNRPRPRLADESGAQVDTASAAYFSVVTDELERIDRRLVPPQRARLKLLNSAHVPAQESRGVFDHAYLQGGCGVLLLAGRGVDHAAFDPASHLLDQARSVAALIWLWQALQVHYHSHLRIEVVGRGERALCLRHYSLRSTYSLSIAETLILSGLMIARLERLGCRETRCCIGADPLATTVVYDDGRCLEGLLSAAVGSSNIIRLSWTLRAHGASRDAIPVDNILPPEAHANQLIRRVMLELSRDLELSWSIEQMARCAGTSRRTLQRVFHRSGLSFKTALAAARLRAACHMLSGTFMPITEIALSCGYTDSAHFSRQFRRAAGMTPSVYRRIGYECRLASARA